VCDRNDTVRTIGLLGGMSWHATAEYYRLINSSVQERLGGVHSARSVIVSVDMTPVGRLLAAGEWDELGRLLGHEAAAVEAAGADLFLITANSLQNVWDAIVGGLSIPSLHIGDATGEALERDGHRTAALLGTRVTMELPFLRERLADRYGIEALVPDAEQRRLLDQAIFEEFHRGEFRSETRAAFIEVVTSLQERGATAAILGCTEIGLLLSAEDVELPLYDTTRLHAEAAVDAALADQAVYDV